MTIQLRNAEVSDEACCVELLSELKLETASHRALPLGKSFRQLVTKERGQITLAVEGEIVLGMATVSYNLAMRYGGEYCQLEELVVTSYARGKNIGGLLVRRIIDNARERGCAEIGLYLLKSTKHNRLFYEKHGFEVFGLEMRQSLR